MFNEQAIISRIFDENINSTQRIHVAVSGGADSMCLLYLVSKITDADIIIHHVKHNISKNTNEWANFVRATSESFGFNIEHQYVEHDLHFDSMTNFEAEARKKRYEAIFSYMSEEDILLLGHHLDDQVENVLINIFKGRGINGITSLQEKSVHDNFILLRPLINTEKKDIITFLNNQGVKFVHDESNDSSDYDRNFIRNKVIPMLLTRFKPLKNSILSVHKALTNSKVVMEELINDKISSISDENGINVFDYNKLSKETRTEILINLLRREGCYTYNQKVIKEFISQVENIQKNGGVCLENNTYKTKMVIKNGEDTFEIIFKKIHLNNNNKKKVFLISKHK
jgi:tRNA(Ile)-lysidine synthase